MNDLLKKVDEYIDELRPEYNKALEEAQKAAATTKTHGWSKRYQIEINDHRKKAQQETQAIIAIAEQLSSSDDEDLEKAIKISIKSLSEERVQHQAWLDRAVWPFKRTVDAVAVITRNAIQEAQQQEKDSPLHLRGFAEEVRKELHSWAVPKWDEKTGTVTIVNPSITADVKAA